MTAPSFKIPESVLVVIHTAALDVLLIRRADATDFWQSVTGSKDSAEETLAATAAREVLEETGIDCGAGTQLAPALRDWGLQRDYEIYPQWRHRYHPSVLRNTEHVFGLCVPAGTPVRLDAREHDAWQWLPWQAAAERCFSSTNAEAIRLLPQFLAGADPTT